MSHEFHPRKTCLGQKEINTQSTKRQPQIIIDSQYTLIKKIVNGTGISDIFLASNNNTKEYLVIKMIKPAYNTMFSNYSNHLIREGEIMSQISHHNILKVYPSNFTGIQSGKGSHGKKVTYIPMEYANKGDLLSLVQSVHYLPENVALYLFKQIIEGISAMHSMGICHRDIKLDNILLDKDFNVKIADFEYAEYFKEDSAMVKFRNKVGTERYMAPELHFLHLHEKFYYGNMIDVFSCGIVLLAMVTGRLYFETSSTSDYYYRMFTQDTEAFFSLLPNCSMNLIELIKKMLCINPNERVEIEQIKKDPIFNDVNREEAMMFLNKGSEGFPEHIKKEIN